MARPKMYPDELIQRGIQRDAQPLPAGLSPHKLRHSFASILVARVYAHMMRREEGERGRLRALVEGREWAPTGTGADDDVFGVTDDSARGNADTPAGAGVSRHRGARI
jgi:hypothetical protein